MQAHVYPLHASPSLQITTSIPPPPPPLATSGCSCSSVSTDWSHSGDEHAAAYTRAGLPHWAAQCLSEPSSPTGAASQPNEPAGPASQAAGPSAVVQATVSDVLLTLPHDQDFGRAERFVELWSKAFGQVGFTACSCPYVDAIH